MNQSIHPSFKIELRANAHHLKPVVIIGLGALTKGVLKEIDLNLKAHQLIKVRIMQDNAQQRKIITEDLCATLRAHLIQSIGKILVIYRTGDAILEHDIPEKNQKKDNTMSGPRELKVRKTTRGTRRNPIKIVTVLGNQRVTAGGLVKRKKKIRQVSKKKLFENN
jgi:RNA-binding protein